MTSIEIKPIQNLNASVEAPSSKSYTNRALIAASLADGISYLENCLLSDDTKHMMKALEQLGIPFTMDNCDITVMGRAGRIGIARNPIFAGNAGTTLRFLASFLALGHSRYTLDGDERMRERPVLDLIEGLQQLGVKIKGSVKEGYPPLVIEADGIQGGKTSVRGEKSSQYLSSLLLAAPCAQSDIEIEVIGDLVSKPYVKMTLDVMKAFGISVEQKGGTFKIHAPQKYKPAYYRIEGDASNASYFFAAAAIAPGKVRVNNIYPNTAQGDISLVDLLGQMGCKIVKQDGWIEIEGGPLKGIDVDMKDMPDMVQTLAIVALFAKGKTTIRNIAHLKIKETDRIGDLARELAKIGAKVEAGPDFLTVEGGELKGAPIETYNDHRMAMSFAVAGLKIAGITIENPGCVGKSFPDFWERFQTLYLS
jgi:3-phosphoshikimate 1-carboxyvinyltransferase